MFYGTVSDIKTMDPEKATWEYFSARLRKELISQTRAENQEVASLSITSVAARMDRERSIIPFFKGNKRGHISRYCKIEAGSYVNEVQDE